MLALLKFGATGGAQHEDAETDATAEKRELAEQAPGFVLGGGELDRHDGDDTLEAGGNSGRAFVGERNDLGIQTEIGRAAKADLGQSHGVTVAAANKKSEAGFHAAGGKEDFAVIGLGFSLN